jgi:hypothetical protein
VIGRLTAACLLFTAGCHTPLTEIVIQTNTDLRVPSDLDEVRFEIDGRPIGARDVVVRSATLSGPSASELPIVLGLLHEGDAPFGPIEVRAIGLRQGAEVVRNATTTYFVRERSVLLPLDLWAACADVVCPSNEVCSSNGACIDVDAGVDAGIDSGSVDAGMDSGTPDAGPPDAGPYCLPTDECFDGCGCGGGCSCDLKCSSGDTCYGSFCSDPGTTCKYKGDGAAYFDFSCLNGAYCVTDVRNHAVVGNFVCNASECWTRCKDSNYCPIHCDNAASCVLVCEAATNCGFATCYAGIVDCGGGVFTCNHACPSVFPAW